MPRLTGHLPPKRNWPTWPFSVLITHLVSGSGPVGVPPVPWTEKTIEGSQFFVRRGGHCCRRNLVGRTNFWIFFSDLQKLKQRAKNCIELLGQYVEWTPSLLAVACFLPGRAKDLSAHPRVIAVVLCRKLIYYYFNVVRTVNHVLYHHLLANSRALHCVYQITS